MKLEKNYYRCELVKLFKDNNHTPLIFTGKYKHTDSKQWITLTNIRHFLPEQEKQRTICDHINLDKSTIPSNLILNATLHNRQFCFFGELSFYHYYGEERASIKLAQIKDTHYIWQKHQNQNKNLDLIHKIQILLQNSS